MQERTGLFSKKFLYLLSISCIFFGVLFLIQGVKDYGDSHQYVSMHIHREPGYSLFLWGVRAVFGQYFLSMAAAIQNIFAAIVTAGVVHYISNEFALKKIGTGILLLLNFVPHIVTPLFSVEHVIFSNGIMSEAICYPLFLLFVVMCHKMIMDYNIKNISIAAILAFMLALTRSQFMVAFLIWLVLLCIKAISLQKSRYAILYIMLVIVMFLGRSVTVKSYNYIFNGRFISNTYGGVNTLANILYASNREDGQRIDDPIAQEVFYILYDSMVEAGWDKSKAGTSLKEQTDFLEVNHDNIKFYVVDQEIMDFLVERGMSDYIDRNIESDRISMIIIKSIMPSCIVEWGKNYFLLAFRGMIRSIGVVHPVLNWGVLGIYILAFLIWIREWVKNIHSKEGWLIFISLLSILAVSFSLPITIMCLSRYTIYNFVGFYMALFVCILKICREKGEWKWVTKI